MPHPLNWPPQASLGAFPLAVWKDWRGCIHEFTAQRKEHSKTEFGKKNSEKKLGESETFYRANLDVRLACYLPDIILCLWSGFISPRIRTFVETRFHGLFSKKKDSKSGGLPSFLSWKWGQLLLQRKTVPTRLLGLLEKQSKIWRYDHIQVYPSSMAWRKVFTFLPSRLYRPKT